MTESKGPLEHLWMGGRARNYEGADPLVIERGQGIYLWDTAGNKYIDAIASLEAVAIGHGRVEIRDAIVAQLDQLEFHDTLRYTNSRAIELANRLSDLSPMRSASVHFASSGSEAVESALKIVRQYNLQRGEPLREKVIGRQFAYHGCTQGAMALDGNYYRSHREYFNVLTPPSRFVPADAGADEFEKLILTERPETVAAVVIDPMATASGIYPQNGEFWSQLRAICDKYGVLLVADEVITAFGRTGEWFASGSGSSAVPDIITASKALSSGYYPISAVIVDERISSMFGSETTKALAHGHTYGGHPVACAAALENLRIIESEGLVEAARERGAQLAAELDRLKSHRLVSQVRGRGLLFGLDLADESRTDAPAGKLGTDVVAALQDLGVLTFVLHPGNVLFICPPLIVTSAEIVELVGRVSTALDVVANQQH